MNGLTNNLHSTLRLLVQIQKWPLWYFSAHSKELGPIFFSREYALTQKKLWSGVRKEKKNLAQSFLFSYLYEENARVKLPCWQRVHKFPFLQTLPVLQSSPFFKVCRTLPLFLLFSWRDCTYVFMYVLCMYVCMCVCVCVCVCVYVCILFTINYKNISIYTQVC